MDLQRKQYQQKSLFTKVAEWLLTVLLGTLLGIFALASVVCYLYIIEKGMI